MQLFYARFLERSNFALPVTVSISSWYIWHPEGQIESLSDITSRLRKVLVTCAVDDVFFFAFADMPLRSLQEVITEI